VDVEEEVVIGREDTDLEIDDPELSRRHAVVRRFANRLQVEDLGSTNGTYVDGTRIAEPTLLGGGAQIKIGTTVLAVEGVLPVSESADVIGGGARNVTRVSPAISTTPSAGAPQAAVAPEGGAPAPAAPASAPVAPTAPAVGEFRPPQHRRQRGLASRSWVPVALSFGTVVLVAIALVIYFSQHT
jgi:hypothetical protein